MKKLKSLLRAGETPSMGIYLRILAVAYLAGTIFHFVNLFGYGEISWEEMPIPWKIVELFYAQFGAITMVGLWVRRPWGILCFFIAAISQLILYWGFPELFGQADESLKILQGMINFHISTLAIFFIIRIKGK